MRHSKIMHALMWGLLWSGVFSGSVARAQDPVIQALQVLDDALHRETQLSSETRDALRGVATALRADREAHPRHAEHEAALTRQIEAHSAEALLPPAHLATLERWSRLSFGGDFRLRHESNFELDDRPDRHRQVLRLRLWANFQVLDDLSVRLRMVTGDPNDPNSPHYTLGTVFNKVDWNLDRAHLVYEPTWAKGLRVVAGKFGHEFDVNPVYGELVWDADVQPEGLLLAYRAEKPIDGIRSLTARASAYHLLEQSGADDAFLFAGQLAGAFDLGDDLGLRASVAYSHYEETAPDGSQGIIADNQGNRVVTRVGPNGPFTDFLSDFGIVDTVLALDLLAFDIPVTFAGELIWNARARDGRDLGFALGASVGQAKAAGDWRVYYSFQQVAQDAVFSAFAQDDFLFATNHQSHLFGTNYMIADSVGLHLWALISALDNPGSTRTTDSDAEQFRIRLDLNITF